MAYAKVRLDPRSQFAKGCYPRAFPTEAVLSRTDSLTAATDTPDSLRRLLLENADDVRRALRARAADLADSPDAADMR